MSKYSTHDILCMIECKEGLGPLDLSGENLVGIDLSREVIQEEWTRLREVNPEEEPTWLSPSIPSFGAGRRARWIYVAGSERPAKDKLRGINLAQAKFQGADLSDADLHGANLGGTDFQENAGKAKLVNANLRETELSRAKLQGADLQMVNLQDANLFRANLQEADLRDANLQGANLMYANLDGTNLEGANLTRVDLLNAERIQRVRLYQATLDHTQVTKSRLEGAIAEDLNREWSRATEVYLALKNNFEQIGRYSDASWAYIKERRMKRACRAPWRCRKYYRREQPFWPSIRDLLAKWWPNVTQWQYGCLPRRSPLVWWFWLKYAVEWAADWLVDLLCAYGERIGHVIRAILLVWIIFAGVYWHIAGVWAPQQETATDPLRYTTLDWRDLLSFSLGAMTTLIPSDLQARSMRAMRFLVPSQAMCGIFLAGLLGFVAGNRIRRS